MGTTITQPTVSSENATITPEEPHGLILTDRFKQHPQKQTIQAALLQGWTRIADDWDTVKKANPSAQSPFFSEIPSFTIDANPAISTAYTEPHYNAEGILERVMMTFGQANATVNRAIEMGGNEAEHAVVHILPMAAYDLGFARVFREGTTQVRALQTARRWNDVVDSQIRLPVSEKDLRKAQHDTAEAINKTAFLDFGIGEIRGEFSDAQAIHLVLNHPAYAATANAKILPEAYAAHLVQRVVQKQPNLLETLPETLDMYARFTNKEYRPDEKIGRAWYDAGRQLVIDRYITDPSTQVSALPENELFVLTAAYGGAIIEDGGKQYTQILTVSVFRHSPETVPYAAAFPDSDAQNIEPAVIRKDGTVSAVPPDRWVVGANDSTQTFYSLYVAPADGKGRLSEGDAVRWNYEADFTLPDETRIQRSGTNLNTVRVPTDPPETVYLPLVSVSTTSTSH